MTDLEKMVKAMALDLKRIADKLCGPVKTPVKSEAEVTSITSAGGRIVMTNEGSDGDIPTQLSPDQKVGMEWQQRPRSMKPRRSATRPVEDRSGHAR